MSAEGWQLKIRYQIVPGTNYAEAVGIDLGVPELSDDVLAANAARCRVFFAVKEDNYLPSVVQVLRESVGSDRRVELARLKERVGVCVRDGVLIGAHMYSGRLEADNGLGKGQLLGNDQIAMDFIYGHLLHEDRDAAARLKNVSTDETMRHAVITKLHDLMQAAYWTRYEILRAAADDELDFQLAEQPDD